MAGMQDHICSSTCMFCKLLDNPVRDKHVGQRFTPIDNSVLERVKELEQRSVLNNTQTTLGTAKGEELEKLALLDSLTELYNSRTFLKELKDEVKRSRRYNRPVSLCIISIDGYKDIGKEFGALTSDAVLKVVANALRSCIRDVDIAARYSGGEFALVLPETNASGAAVVAERIREKIGTQSITHNWHNIKITASVGVVSFPTHAQEHDELAARAIQALELSIQRGGDRVCTL